MRIAKEDVPVRIDVPGATARQQTDFGDATGYGKISGEYFSFGAGTDITPLLHGLEGDLCQCPHWGYVLKGQVRIIYADQEEILRAGDAYYLAPGHHAVYEAGTESVEFSPNGPFKETMEVATRNLEAMK